MDEAATASGYYRDFGRRAARAGCGTGKVGMVQSLGAQTRPRRWCSKRRRHCIHGRLRGLAESSLAARCSMVRQARAHILPSGNNMATVSEDAPQRYVSGGTLGNDADGDSDYNNNSDRIER
jgi:hypothetical protein